MTTPDILAGGYDPEEVEAYALDRQAEPKAHAIKGGGSPYTVVLPPPNVTGSLHMGHALNHTLQDILVRYHRMAGHAALWQPGTDHAGIATQNVVEKELAGQNLSREELGRDTFLEQVWKWKEKSGNRIVEQQKRLGESCDWSRARFTMDEGLSKAVRKVFVTLYEEKLIYRGNYMINWCPRCGTALSDLEVEMRETDGALYHMRYPVVGSDRQIEVATTRPETYMGDTAVAVHPEDSRYASGLLLQLPFMDRQIPVIRDEHVDREYGTGCLKVTPAHDFNDFDIGQRHKLEVINILTATANINEQGGPFAGMTREEARKAVVERFDAAGLLGEIEPIKHMVGHCYRCDTVVEPRLSRQWFVKTRPLADEAIKAVRDGRTTFYPENWSKTYFEWLDNIRDWCISRQIWWGHRIPVWVCENDHEFAAIEDPDCCNQCSSTKLQQETDVLDTWFSSALWPFSTLGWPEDSDLLRQHYPTSVLVTGFDILFFWVARMMMMGLKFMGDVPFREVYIHALVRDEQGNKMSKTRGNVIDPLDIIKDHGADALRFTLASMTALGRDIKLSIPRIEGYRHFCNKIWNAVRFCQMQAYFDQVEGLVPTPVTLADRWILGRLDQLSDTVEKALKNYRFNDLANALYSFIRNDFCDWYLETCKSELKRNETSRKETSNNLRFVLRSWLTLLHPVMPFLTEYIWDRALGLHDLPHTPWKIGFDKRYEKDIDLFEAYRQLITQIRSTRAENGFPPSAFLPLHLSLPDPDAPGQLWRLLPEQEGLLCDLARIKTIVWEPANEKAAADRYEDIQLEIPFAGFVDIDAEIQRLFKELAKCRATIEKLEKKLGNDHFVARAPEDVVAKNRSELQETRQRYQTLARRKSWLEESA